MARILVVEDNPDNMMLAVLLLESAGHAVLCAIDAEAGLTLAREGGHSCWRERKRLCDQNDLDVAEREGFEPSVEFPLHTLSKRAPSTARPSLLTSRINSLA